MKLPLVLGVLVLSACTPVVSPYEAEQLKCVADASTREQADACRCEVKARYGNACDAGADAR